MSKEIQGMSRVDISELEIGDVIYENYYGQSDEVTVTSKPQSAYSDDLKATQWSFTGTVNGEEGEYMLTEGLEHYGPDLTWEPDY